MSLSPQYWDAVLVTLDWRWLSSSPRQRVEGAPGAPRPGVHQPAGRHVQQPRGGSQAVSWKATRFSRWASPPRHRHPHGGHCSARIASGAPHCCGDGNARTYRGAENGLYKVFTCYLAGEICLRRREDLFAVKSRSRWVNSILITVCPRLTQFNCSYDFQSYRKNTFYNFEQDTCEWSFQCPRTNHHCSPALVSLERMWQSGRNAHGAKGAQACKLLLSKLLLSFVFRVSSVLIFLLSLL